jgi:23S rRNA (cytosine1962-C5)-methyltransferase
MELLPLRGIYERSDADVRKKEGLETSVGVLTGQTPPDFIEVQESGYRVLVDVRSGHKTGFYLDQRINRQILSQAAAGKNWLNCFSYTGAFGLAALSGGASQVTNVDTSGPALEIARKSYGLNSIDISKASHIEADVFSYLRRCRDSGEKFDGIVLDPPKFAESKSQVDGACRGYKDINLLAIKLLNPGGLLFTFSCSGSVDVPLFEKVVASAAMDSGRFVRVLQRLGQAPDHPSCLTFPEGHYLKGLLCRVE